MIEKLTAIKLCAVLTTHVSVVTQRCIDANVTYYYLCNIYVKRKIEIRLVRKVNSEKVKKRGDCKHKAVMKLVTRKLELA